MAAFKQVAVIDFEYQSQMGPDDDRPILPKPLCLVAYLLDENLNLVRVIRQWFDEFGSAPPFDVGPDTVVVAYSAWAEMQCFMQLNWVLPDHVLDLHTAYLAVSNILRPAHEEKIRVKKDLVHACFAYGIEGWSDYDKTTIAPDIGRGLWRRHGKQNCLGYCEEDVKRTAELLQAMLRDRLRPIDPVRVISWSEYSATCVARIQAKGLPIGSELWEMVQEHKARVLENLLREFDPTWGGALYEDDPRATPLRS